MAFIKTWDESVPAGSRAANLGDDDIRDFKYAIRERMAVEHYLLATEGGDSKIGYHKKLTMIDQVADLLGVAGALVFYGKTTSGVCELFAVLPDNTVIQLTSNGKLNSASIDGVIPIANLAAGTPDGTKFLRDDGTLQVPDKSANDGEVVQVVSTQTGEVNTGTTLIPYDDTIPQKTEGDEYMTLAITPKASTNKLKIEVSLWFSNTSGDNVCVALFQDDIAAALACGNHVSGGSINHLDSIEFTHYMDSGSTDEITFKVRAGNQASGTLTFNGVAGSRYFGGVLASSITITEIQAS